MASSCLAESPAVERWADLLVCEHLALNAVQRLLNIAAAQTRIRKIADRTFLEVVRFDRTGEFGRSAVCTLQSLNTALLGAASTSWNKVALQLHREGFISGADAHTIELIWWFGRLIANTDMHEGNLAFRPGLTVAPVYDMLPMFYAPARGGEVAPKTFSPQLPLPPERGAWAQAAAAAVEYWAGCAGDVRISAACDNHSGRW